jgi:hypothetical protein
MPTERLCTTDHGRVQSWNQWAVDRSAGFLPRRPTSETTRHRQKRSTDAMTEERATTQRIPSLLHTWKTKPSPTPRNTTTYDRIDRDWGGSRIHRRSCRWDDRRCFACFWRRRPDLQHRRTPIIIPTRGAAAHKKQAQRHIRGSGSSRG